MHCLPKVNDGDPQCDQHNTEKQHAPSSNRKGACPNKPWQHFRMLWGKRQRQFREALRTQTSFPMSALPNQLYNFDGK
jgi:hypothetical protein